MTDVQAVSNVLAAISDALSPLRSLWGAVLSVDSRARVEARVHPTAAGGISSYTVAYLTATRPDGRSVTWSVSLWAGDVLRINGEVEIDAENGGTASLFNREEVAIDAGDAARLIREFAAEVAAQRSWFDDPTIPAL
jgi:hypothetical protein